jgi:hypothetical protein
MLNQLEVLSEGCNKLTSTVAQLVGLLSYWSIHVSNIKQ